MATLHTQPFNSVRGYIFLNLQTQGAANIVAGAFFLNPQTQIATANVAGKFF